jgi:hypothetical protein
MSKFRNPVDKENNNKNGNNRGEGVAKQPSTKQRQPELKETHPKNADIKPLNTQIKNSPV